MGLNNAVMVVGGCEGEVGTAAPDKGDVADGIWKDGGVASGKVVKRMPVETDILMSHFSSPVCCYDSPPALFSFALK
jgi:hypothetical protein